MHDACVQEVVSPELALVDAELAARARLADTSGVSRPVRGQGPPAPSALVATRIAEPRARRTGFVLVMTLTALATVLLIGEARRSDGPIGASALSSAVAGGAQTATPARRGDATVSRDRSVRARAKADPGRTATNEAIQVAPPQQRTATRRDKARATALSWERVPEATTYELVLVRSGRQIYLATSRSPDATVPRRWRHGGALLRIRPEDQAYVWPVVAGRRATRPIVDGVLALDLTLGASFPG